MYHKQKSQVIPLSSFDIDESIDGFWYNFSSEGKEKERKEKKSYNGNKTGHVGTRSP